MRKILSPEEWSVAKQLRGIGKKDREIAEILGCSRSSISHGLAPQKPEIPVSPAPPSDTVNERIVEALELMRSNGKRSFTTDDLGKALPGITHQNICHYLAGRHGDVTTRVPFNQIAKLGNRLLYTFINGQTVLPTEGMRKPDPLGAELELIKADQKRILKEQKRIDARVEAFEHKIEAIV